MAALASSSRALRSFISVSVAAPHVDLGHAAGQLGQPLLQLLAIVIAVGDFDLAANLLGAAVDGVLLAGAADDRRVLGVDDDLLGPAQVGQLDGVELDAQVLEDRRAAGQHGDVAEHRLAAIAVAGGLHGTDVAGCRAAC